MLLLKVFWAELGALHLIQTLQFPDRQSVSLCHLCELLAEEPVCSSLFKVSLLLKSHRCSYPFPGILYYFPLTLNSGPGLRHRAGTAGMGVASGEFLAIFAMESSGLQLAY